MTELKEDDLLEIKMEEKETIGDLKKQIHDATGESGQLKLFCCLTLLDDDAMTLGQLVDPTKVN